MIKKISFLFLILSLVSFVFITNFSELVMKKLENYEKEYPEKVYVQTDKPYYVTGDDIWFTSYLVNGITHTKSDKSRVIYVELINEQDSIVSKKRLYTDDITAAGDFKIEKNWKPGNYILRAYTNYMRNESTNYFFKKEIPIWNINSKDSLIRINNTKNKLSQNTTGNTKLEIDFYPESGYLVYGINSILAIKTTDNLGRNISINGIINDSDDNFVTTFQTFQFGVGKTYFVPEKGKTYYASVTINNEELKFKLPKILDTGYNLQINNLGENLALKVTTNLPIGLKDTYLIAHQRGKLIFKKQEPNPVESYQIKLSNQDIEDGITTFVLFDNNGNAVCERLVYINNPKNDIQVNFQIENKNPKIREKVTVQIDLKDKNNQPIYGNLSVAITDLDAIEHSSNHENIKTYLLLNSDLRGKIESPGYFFEKENEAKRKYLLDLMMLTHGWRRFIWNDILYNNNPKTVVFTPEKGIYINGRTTNLKGAKKQFSAATRLSFIDKMPFQENKQSNNDGTFNYGPYIFNDTLPTIIEARVKDFKSDHLKDNRFVSIFLNDNSYNAPKINRDVLLKSNPIDVIKITSFFQQAQKRSLLFDEVDKSYQLLDEVVIKANKVSEEEKRDEELNSRSLHGSASNRIDMKDYENQTYLNLMDLLSMVPGVMASNGGISIRNQGTPLILLDGMQMELEDIQFLTAFDIEFIDVLKGAEAAIYPNSGNGVIAIYLKMGGSSKNRNVPRKPGVINFKALGFNSPREFYAPNYSNNLYESYKQDIRTTLHWIPKIEIIPTANKHEFSFFTSDSKSKYAIKIEGITNTGIPIYYLTTFETY